jgi:hypothetical protein
MHRNYSISGALFQVAECSSDWLENAKYAAFRFRSYQSPLCSDFPGLQLEKFPSPVQNLLLEQVNQARKWVEQGEPLYTRIVIPGWRDEATAEVTVDPPGNDTLTGTEDILHSQRGRIP